MTDWFNLIEQAAFSAPVKGEDDGEDAGDVGASGFCFVSIAISLKRIADAMEKSSSASGAMKVREK